MDIGKRTVGRPSRQKESLPGIDRREQIVREAARLFAEHGYDRTSMRDIAAAAGILSGSVYYHFASKEALFIEVHGQGMAILTAAAQGVIAAGGEPWEQLERLASAHCRAILDHAGFMLMVFPRFPDALGPFRIELKAQRNAYERIVSGVIAALNLPDGIDRTLFRLQFLGALNWSQTWFRPEGGATPEEIGAHLVRLLRGGG